MKKLVNVQDSMAIARIRLYSTEEEWIAYEYSAYLLIHLIPDSQIRVDQSKELVYTTVTMETFMNNSLGEYLDLVNEGVCELLIPSLTLPVPFLIWKEKVTMYTKS